MVVPKHTSGSLIARFLVKKLLVYILLLGAIALFQKNPLSYGYLWLVATFLLWCAVDVASLYGDIWAYADLREALASGRDPSALPSEWVQRDTNLEKFDGLMLIVAGVGMWLLGYTKWLAILGLGFGLLKCIPFMAEADPRNIDEMVTVQ